MNMSRSGRPPPLAWIAWLLILLWGAAIAQKPADHLYRDAPISAGAVPAGLPAADVAVTGQKPIVPNLGYLRSQIARGQGELSLEWVDGSTVVLELTRVERRGPEDFTWRGRVRGYSASEVLLTVVADQLSGSISLGDDESVLRIRPGDGDIHWLQLVDRRAFPPDHPGAGPPRAPLLAASGDAATNTTQSPAGSADAEVAALVDVMVVWSSQAAAAGGSGIAAEAQNAIDSANSVYSNSGIDIRLRLVYAGPANYSESGDFSTDLNRLTSRSDGHLDAVHALRDQFGADLVALFVENMQYCGIGWVGPNANYGFTVVNRSCATGNLSYVHEVGHNIGALHDPYVDPSTSPYAYGHGYVNVPQRWRTVMAYNNQCSAAGTSCARIAYMSNPLATYPPTGAVLGTPASGSTPTSDNARVHNQNALVVAGFRNATSTGGCSYELAPAGASVEASGAASSFTVSTPAGCVWNAASNAGWLTIAPTSPTSGPGTLAYSVAANTGPARSAAISVGDASFAVNQASGCTVQLSPTSASFDAPGGSGSIAVGTNPGCSWSASSSAGWLRVVTPARGVGSATTTYSVDANAGVARSANIVIGGATFTVTQRAPTTSSAVASLAPTALSFGSISIGKTSASQTATLTNTGASTLTISALTLGGSNPDQFVRSGTCNAATSLVAGASCSVVVRFAPTSAGTMSATVTISSNASASPVLALSGTGGKARRR